MKRWITAGFALFILSGLAYGADQGAVSPPSGQKQMETDQEVAKRSDQVTPLNRSDGDLVGEVVGVNPSEGTLEIQTAGGGVSKIKVEDNIKDQLKDIKKGDHVDAKITLRATALNKKQG